MKKILLAFSLLGVSSISQAALIDWSTPASVSATSDIVTTGTFFDSATTFLANDLNINGVTFNHALTPISGVMGFNNSSGITFSNYTSNSFSSGNGAPASYDSAYRSFLGVAAGALDKNLNISLNNLTIGNEYLVQLWTPYWDNNNWKTSFSDGVNTSSLLDTGFVNNGGNTVRTAQYVIGSFIADATSQTIKTVADNRWSLVSGLQVRTTSVAAVPEPETYAMFLAGLGLLGFAARRKQS